MDRDLYIDPEGDVWAYRDGHYEVISSASEDGIGVSLPTLHRVASAFGPLRVITPDDHPSEPGAPQYVTRDEFTSLIRAMYAAHQSPGGAVAFPRFLARYLEDK